MQKAILEAALFTPTGRGRWGLPMLFWGPPGAAKTSVISSVCEQFTDLPLEVLSPAERGDGAFGVIGVPAHSKLALETAQGAASAAALDAMSRLTAPDILTNPRPDWTVKFDGPKRGVVFIDELSLANPMLQAPILGLALERRIGAHTMPPGVRIIAAANPPNTISGGFDLSSAAGNRFGHADWLPPSVEEHVAYMMGGGVEEEAPATMAASDLEREVMVAWPDAFAEARGLEVAFIQRFPALKHQLPPMGSDAGRAWPSDRSWVSATRALASSKVHKLSQTQTEIFVSAFVGEKAGQQFFGWLENQDMPSPAAVLDGKEKFTHDVNRADRTAAVLAGCAALVIPASADKRKERADAFWSLLDSVLAGGQDMDICVPSVSALINAKLRGSPKTIAALAKIDPMLERANVKPGQF